MNFQEYNVEDLFIHYVSRLSGDYPYIKLICDDISTTISLGYEQCDDQEKEISHQAFVPLGKYPVAVNLQRLESFFEKCKFTITVLSANEILVKNRTEISECWWIEDVVEDAHLKVSEELLKHLENHQRSILQILKVRYSYCKDSSGVMICDNPIPIGNRDLAEAYFILSCNPSYIGFGEINCGNQLGGNSFTTSRYEIQHLAGGKFSISVLNEGQKSIILEIINTEL